MEEQQEPELIPEAPRHKKIWTYIGGFLMVSLAIGGALIIFNTVAPGDPLKLDEIVGQGKSYAAAQVVSDVKAGLETPGASDATFLDHRSSFKIGPAYQRCIGSDLDALGDYTRTELVFRDATHQAWLVTASTDKLMRIEYYGENLNGEVADFAMLFADPAWNRTLKTYLAVATLVDDKGQPLAEGAELRSERIDGVEYLELHLAYKQSDNPKEQFCYQGEKAFGLLRLRADTRKVTAFRVYLDNFNAENLVSEDTHTFTYQQGSFTQFESIFTAAGFNKDQGRTNVAALGQLFDPSAPRQGL